MKKFKDSKTTKELIITLKQIQMQLFCIFARHKKRQYKQLLLQTS